MIPQIITFAVLTVMILISFFPLYLSGSYIIMRPLLQPFAAQQYVLLPGIPITGIIPVTLIAFSVFICLYRKEYTFLPPNAIFLYLLSIFSVFSLVNTPNMFYSISHLLKLLTVIAMYNLVYNAVKSQQDAIKIIYAIVISSIGPMLVGYFQFFTNQGEPGIEGTANRITGGLGEANAYGVFLSLCICAALIIYLTTQSGFLKRILIILIFSMIISSFLALNRGSWIALSVSILSASVVYRKKINFKILATVFLLIFILFSSTIVNRFSQLNETHSWGGSKNTFSGRVQNWNRVIRIFSNHPFVGHGIGTTDIIMRRHYDRSSVPHNDYLRIALEMGILALPFYLIFIGRELLFSIKKVCKNVSLWNFNFPILIVLFYWIIISFVQNNIYNVISFPIFISMIAIHRKMNLLFFNKNDLE